ncbi:MAG: hypothetical protein IJ043_00855 [Clostridia bacterium]|nr:hypothetical protein [Clostridia bacterium]
MKQKVIIVLLVISITLVNLSTIGYVIWHFSHQNESAPETTPEDSTKAQPLFGTPVCISICGFGDQIQLMPGDEGYDTILNLNRQRAEGKTVQKIQDIPITELNSTYICYSYSGSFMQEIQTYDQPLCLETGQLTFHLHESTKQTEFCVSTPDGYYTFEGLDPASELIQTILEIKEKRS